MDSPKNDWGPIPSGRIEAPEIENADASKSSPSTSLKQADWVEVDGLAFRVLDPDELRRRRAAEVYLREQWHLTFAALARLPDQLEQVRRLSPRMARRFSAWSRESGKQKKHNSSNLVLGVLADE